MAGERPCTHAEPTITRGDRVGEQRNALERRRPCVSKWLVQSRRPVISAVGRWKLAPGFELDRAFVLTPNHRLNPTANMNSASTQHATKYAISRFNRIMLMYGAIYGFLLVLYASGNPWLAVVLGVPPGIFGFGDGLDTAHSSVTGSVLHVPLR